MFASMSELEFYDGVNKLTVTYPFASSSYSTYTPEKAFDGDTFWTIWMSNSEAYPKHIGNDFGAPVSVNKMRICSQPYSDGSEVKSIE